MSFALEDWYARQCDGDWIHYWVAENRFEVRCGPRNLSEAIQLFVAWFDSN